MITSPDKTPLSPLTFGTMQFGGRADAAQSQATFDSARAANITHFDTAWVYNEGQSERLLGQFLSAERDSFVVATKVGYVGGAGRANMLAQFEDCRSRLDMDYVDILYLHRFDPETDLKESLDTFAQLKARGQIGHVGLSNFAGWQIMKAQSIAADFDLRISIVQPMYSLVKRQVEVEIIPVCVDQGIEIAPYSPLGGGLLTGKYLTGGTGRLTEDDRYATRYGVDWMHAAAKGLSELAAARQVFPATLAVAWAMAHNSRPRPIISARSVEQLEPSLAALSYEMTPELYAQITALSETPAPATDRLEEA